MMIKGIGRIENFGVFENYSEPDEIEDFAENNIIYGWNYSGKTTLSRIFKSIQDKTVHPDYSAARFKIFLSDSSQITESDLATTSLQVRVFNSDFIAKNLSWDGDSFIPILLLGDESVQAQLEIQKNNKFIERTVAGYRKKANRRDELDEELRDAKTSKAREIKTSLRLVEAYTAHHLNQQIEIVKANPKKYKLGEEELSTSLKKATASEEDKLSEIKHCGLNSNLEATVDGLAELLSKTPAVTNTIEHLTKNAETAKWVEMGLGLHENAVTCEFCGNSLKNDRLAELSAHFSEDLRLHGKALTDLRELIEKSRLKYPSFHEKDFYPALRPELASRQKEISNAVNAYNYYLDSITIAINEKIKTPFNTIEMPAAEESIESDLNSAIDRINELITQNNETTTDFTKEKQGAVQRLKNHFAAQFFIDDKLEQRDQFTNIVDKHRDWYAECRAKLEKENERLEATISQAQKGREELNQFISKFLIGSNVEIEVVKTGDQERFRLTRAGVPARNLSEGEKTAIALAFFLTKLKEDAELEKLIIYIDDPISSLDSNHIFQLNAVIRDFFFQKDPSDNKWKLRCQQIFFSTHNFEFLGLLKELPINVAKQNRCKLYFVKRLTPNSSTFIDMPESIKRYTSEYQYLWSVIYDFNKSADKANLSVLLALPNAIRRFIELYTYSKIPSAAAVTVDTRAETLFGVERSRRILKVLHHFSHSNNLLGMGQNNDLICDIEGVVEDIIECIKDDEIHYNALMESVTGT